MSALCKRHDITPEFIQGIDGRTLPTDMLTQHYAEELAIRQCERPMGRAELGCALSHKMIYRQILRKDITQALILEDDVTFDNRLPQLFQHLEELPQDWECVLLGHYHNRHKRSVYSCWQSRRLTVDGFKLKRLACPSLGAHGYLLNRSGARKLLARSTPITCPIDWLTGDDSYLNVYALDPPCVSLHPVDSLKSVIETERQTLLQTIPTDPGRVPRPVKSLLRYNHWRTWYVELKILLKRLAPPSRYHRPS